MASIAATGMGAAVLAHSAVVGALPRQPVVDSLGRMLSTIEAGYHFNGWLWHFVDWETGERWAGSEVSTIDTALFISGVLYAAHALRDAQLISRVDRLYGRLDFRAMRTHGGQAPDKRTLSHGWTPEKGYLTAQWSDYAEQLVLILLALSSQEASHLEFRLPRHALPDPLAPREKYYGQTLSLFAHHYSQLFVDPRLLPGEISQDYYNSKIATWANRRYTRKAAKHATYRTGLWGLSATDNGTDYLAYAPGFHDGTVCPPCAIPGVMYFPKAVSRDLSRWEQLSIPGLWGRYGLADSVNVERSWVNPDAVGITVAAAYLGLANAAPKNRIWDEFHRTPAVQAAS
jgi:hypothetical protein